MVLVGYGSNGDGYRPWERVEWMVCDLNYKHLPQRLLLAIRNNDFRHNDKKSVIVSAAVLAHPSRNQGENRAASVLTRHPRSYFTSY